MNVTQLIGDQARQCLPSGSWSTEIPSCLQVMSSSMVDEAGTYSVLYTLTAALVITLVVGSVFVATAFVYFFKKVKRNVAKEADETTSKFKSSTFASSNSLPGDKIYEEIEEYASYAVYDTINDEHASPVTEKLRDQTEIDIVRKGSIKRSNSIYANESIIYDDVQVQFGQKLDKRQASIRKKY